MRYDVSAPRATERLNVSEPALVLHCSDQGQRQLPCETPRQGFAAAGMSARAIAGTTGVAESFIATFGAELVDRVQQQLLQRRETALVARLP